MHIYPLQQRDQAHPLESPTSQMAYFDNTCSSSSWVKWCPVDIVVWSLLFLVIGLVFYKVYSSKRASKTRSASKGIKRKRSYHLDLPYPSSNSNDHLPVYSHEHSGSNSKGESNYPCPSTAIDPYHVVNTIDNSLISKDSQFNGASVPRPVLEQKRAGTIRRLSVSQGQGLGLGIDMESMHYPSPVPAYSEKLPVDGMEEDTHTPPPLAAHLHNARWDT